jgi:hypothetical protein
MEVVREFDFKQVHLLNTTDEVLGCFSGLKSHAALSELGAYKTVASTFSQECSVLEFLVN